MPQLHVMFAEIAPSSELALVAAVVLSSVMFSVSHAAPGGSITSRELWREVLPLTTLGMSWSIIYVLCRNLFVTMAIHALWNARIALEERGTVDR